MEGKLQIYLKQRREITIGLFHVQRPDEDCQISSHTDIDDYSVRHLRRSVHQATG